MKFINDEELRVKINELKAPEKIKTRLQNELKRYESLTSASPEISIIRNYLDTLFNVLCTFHLLQPIESILAYHLDVPVYILY